MQILTDGLAQGCDTLNDLILGHAGVVQAQGVLVAAVGEEGAAVLAIVASSAGPAIAAGSTLPYWLR